MTTADLLRELAGEPLDKGGATRGPRGPRGPHKYIRRWRGPKGKLQYEYPKEPGPRRAAGLRSGTDSGRGGPKSGDPDEPWPFRPDAPQEQVEAAIRRLPREHAVAFDANGRQLLRWRASLDEPHRVSFSRRDRACLRAAAQRGPVHVVHNHGDYSPITPADIHAAVSCNISELLAVLPNGSAGARQICEMEPSPALLGTWLLPRVIEG